MRRLCAEIVQHTPELAHIDMDRVAVTFSQARKKVSHGLQAALTPMRFENGSLFTQQDGRRYTSQRLFDADGQELLYILTFYVPRFLNALLNQKLTTIFHELWHISPSFNGDLRRHSGRCYAHSHSIAHYDAHMQVLVDRWLARSPSVKTYAFLRYNFRQLQSRYGSVTGVTIPHPKMIAVN